MGAKKLGDLTVNDGKGLYDNEGLIDNAIVKLNEAIKDAMNGQYISFCGCVEQVAQMLLCLKKSIKQEAENATAKIEELKRLLQASGTEMVACTPAEFAEMTKKDGAE